MHHSRNVVPDRVHAAAGRLPVMQPPARRGTPPARRVLLAACTGCLLAAPLAAHAGNPPLFSSQWFAASTGRPNGAGVAATGASPLPATATATPQAVQQSIADFARAAQAIAHAQAAQAQAASAAAAAAAVPDGLAPGGLQRDLAASWANAAPPTEASAGGRTTVTVQQTAPQAILSWTSFNVGAHTTLTFDQSAGGSAANTWSALNRVTDPNAAPSQILGGISAPGQVLLINRNGIIFGAGAQVNVGSLIAATAAIADADFLSSANGIYSSSSPDPNNAARTIYVPVFTGATADIQVDSGASITTNVPSTAGGRGGFAMLLGANVANAGAITTPNGQAVLAAGQNFILRQGYGTNALLTSTTLGSEVAVTGNGAGGNTGSASNTGLIQATTGDITMVGRTVMQAGVAYATTSVDQRGTIHLLTDTSDPTATVTLAPGGLTTILPDTSGATATDAWRASLIARSATPAQQSAATAGLLNDEVLLPDRFDQSRIEITTGGTANFAAGSLTMATGGQIAVSAAQRVFAATGAVLDVAGSVGVALPASAGTLVVPNVQGFQLRDSPANRDSGALNNATAYVNIGQLVLIQAGTGGYAQDRYYTAGGLLEVGGELTGVGHTIQEWTTPGGSITLSAGSMVAQPSATFNLAGGSVDYQAGMVNTSWLIGTNGHLYNVNTAPSDLTYSGIFTGFAATHPRWGITQIFNSPLIAPSTIQQGGYTVGRDAGGLTVSAPTVVFEGTIDAGTVVGAEQNVARGAGSTVDPFLLPNATVPQAGSLALTNIAIGESAAAVPFMTDVQVSDPIAPLAGTLDATTPVPSDRANTAWLSASLLDSAGLGGLSLLSSASIEIAAPVTLADGGQVTLTAPGIGIAAPLVVRGGSVTLGDHLSSLGSNNGFLPAGSRVTLAAGGQIDTRGLFTNLLLAPNATADAAFAAGGPVTIDSSGTLALAAGSVIDASAGGTVLATGKVTGAAGGAISLTAFDPAAYSSAGALPAQTPFAIDGTVRSYGSTHGGALTLQIPGAVLISGTPAAATGTPGAPWVLPASFFAGGFSSYTLSAYGGIGVAAGAALTVTEPVLQFSGASLSAPNGSDPAAALSLVLPPVYLANPATAQVAQRAGASLILKSTLDFTSQATNGGPISVGDGASISVDPGSSVTLETVGQITVDGSIRAPGGSISLINDTRQLGSTPGYQAGLSIWLGASSRIDVSAQAFTATDLRGRPFGVVPAGGAVQVGGGMDSAGNSFSTDAYVIAQAGSAITAAGTSSLVDPAAGTGTVAGTRLVASNGGSIALDSTSGLLLSGSLAAPAGGPGAQGGTLSVALNTPVYLTGGTGAAPPNPLLVPRELTIGAGIGAEPTAQPNQPLPDSAIGQAYLTAGSLSAGGFDALTLASGDAILFDGPVALSAGRSITLRAGILAATGPSATAAIAAPYMSLVGTASSLQPGTLAPQLTGYRNTNWAPSTQPAASLLSATASDISVSGNIFVGADLQIPQFSDTGQRTQPDRTVDLPGFAQVTLSSTGAIRFTPGSGSATTLTTPDDLTMAAGQIYPVAGTNALMTAGFDWSPSGNDFLASGVLRLAGAAGPVPPVPLTAGGVLQLAAGAIEQGGVLRAPMGTITLGGIGNNGIGPQLPDAQHSFTQTVDLLPGSITSVSAAGATIPYGGTSEGATYTLDGGTVPLSATTAPKLAILSQAVTVQSGATLDLSGGGTLAGAGFISGRGGSTDVLGTPLLALTATGTITAPSAGTNLVYAIIPGFSGVAPPAATAGPVANAPPQAGDTITLPAGVPGLAAGTYVLLPGSDALLPGAYRVQINTAAHGWLPTAINAGNGSYQVDGYRGVAGTGLQAALPMVVTVTPGAAVRALAQYDEETYSQFAVAQAAVFNTPRLLTPIPEDAKTLLLQFPAQPAANAPGLVVQDGAIVDMQPATGGLGGMAAVTALTDIAVTPAGATPSANAVSLPAASLNALGADTLAIGGYPVASGIGTNTYFSGVTFSVGTAAGVGVTLQDGATLSAPQVFLVGGQNGVTVQPGAGISTLGYGAPSLDSSGGLVFTNSVLDPSNQTDQAFAVVAVSNGSLTFVPAVAPTGPVTIGVCPAAGCGAGTSSLNADGTVTLLTTGGVTIGGAARFGARDLVLSVPSINLGTPVAGQPVPVGINLDQATLSTLLAGDPTAGVPALAQLTLAASQSINIYGSAQLNSTGLTQLEFDTPAIFGAGAANDTATLTVGTLIWNGVLSGTAAATPPLPLVGGPGTGSGNLVIASNQIVLGYGPNEEAQNATALGRLTLGFANVRLAASQSISTTNQGSLAVYQSVAGYDPVTGATTYAGGNLTLDTPLLTGGSGSVNSITAGGTLSLLASAGPAATSGVTALGGEIDLAAASISNATSIALPSGILKMKASGDVVLNGGSHLDLAGRTPSLFDQTLPSFGGTVDLESASGNVVQAAGATIDISAPGSHAGSLSVTAAGSGQGQVVLGGTILGSAPAGFASGSIDLRAQALGPNPATLSSDFATLNALLDTGGVFGSRSFDLKQGDLTIGNLTANAVSVSVDGVGGGGNLTVTGTINASGASPGSILLAATNNLTIGSGAVLDVHESVLHVDSYQQPIPAENSGSIELSAGKGTLTLTQGATLDLSSPDGVARGKIALDVPRTGETSGNVQLSAHGSLTVRGAASIAVNAFATYTPTDPNGTIVQDNGVAQGPAVASATGFVGLDQIDALNTRFINAAYNGNAAAGVLNPPLQAGLAGLTAYGSAFHLRPGVAIDSTATGNLTVSGDLDLSGFRYGPGVNAAVPGSGEPGVLVLRAGGNLNVYGSINDGFYMPATTAYASNPDNQGWILTATPTLDGSSLVLPGTVGLQPGTTLEGSNATFNTDVTLGGTSVTVAANTVLQVAWTLPVPVTIPKGSYWAGNLLSADLTVPAGTVLSAGTRLPVAITIPTSTALQAGTLSTDAYLTTAESLKLPSGIVLQAAITDASGNPLVATYTNPFTKKTTTVTLNANTPLTVPLTLTVGAANAATNTFPVIRLDQGFKVTSQLLANNLALSVTNNTVWPKGESLSAFSSPMTIVTPAVMSAGSVIGGKSTLILDAASSVPGGATCSDSGVCSFRPNGGTVWAVASMLPAGSQSWSLALVAGADLAAAARNTPLAPSVLAASATATDPTPGSLILSDPHYQLPTGNTSVLQPSWSVIRTGTGDLSLLAGGNVREASLYGIYTAGTQSGDFPLTRATPLGGTTLGTAYPLYNAVVGSAAAQGDYPDQGGNLLIAVQGDLSGDITLNTTGNGAAIGYALDSVGAWLWRQGGVNGQPAAWWINSGSYVIPYADPALSSDLPTLAGFVGFGALGGGNVSIAVGGNAGVTAVTTGSGGTYTASNGLIVAVASSGQMNGATPTLTGGGDISITVGGRLNPGATTQNDLNGTITDLRGQVSVQATSIGQVALKYAAADPLDQRLTNPFAPTQANSIGGPSLVPGDAQFTLATRGDLVLGGVGDATRLVQESLSSAGSNADGSTALANTWFSLWQADTAITLYAAGGNATPGTQAAGAAFTLAQPALYANDSSTEGRLLYPPILRVDAPSGNIYGGNPSQITAYSGDSIELAPSPIGQLELLAGGSILADEYHALHPQNAAPAVFDISGASLSAMATPQNPAYDITNLFSNGTIGAGGTNTGSGLLQVTGNLVPNPYAGNLFAFGPDTASPLHAGQPQASLIYAGGDIVNLHLGETLTFTSAAVTPNVWYIAGESVRMQAGGDIYAPGNLPGATLPGSSTVNNDQTNPNPKSTSSLIYNANATDVSEVQAGRDIIYANLSIAGPGQLWVQAGRNVYQANQGSLQSLGADPNLQVGSGGASITVLAGAGANGPDWTGFANLYLNPANVAPQGVPVGEGSRVVAQSYADQLTAFLQQLGYQVGPGDALAIFQALPVEQRRQFLLGIYFDELRDSGREETNPASIRYRSYARGREAIAALFPSGSTYSGDLTLYSSTSTSSAAATAPLTGTIRTLHGGGITLLVPGGQTVLGLATAKPASNAGVLTAGGGDVNIYSLGSVVLGQSRIFTILGGNIVIWSATGDINAGQGANNTIVPSQTTIAYDNYGNILIAPPTSVTGAGIATLAALAGTTPGDLDLIAPLGAIDAGEAGIRSSGNANISARIVLNAANVQVSGRTVGLPTVATPNLGAATAASGTAAAAAQSARQMAQSGATTNAGPTPSTITVDVVGFGEGDNCGRPGQPPCQ